MGLGLTQLESIILEWEGFKPSDVEMITQISFL